jgi:hypothetical protein
MQPSTGTIEFTEAERAALEKKERRWQAAFERMAAAATPEERERIADQLWVEDIERPRATRRVQTARMKVPAPPVQRARARELAAPRERRDSSSSRSSGQDPGGDSDPEQDDGPWALGFVDRAPFLWRFRHLRCRLLEIREGVDR